MNAMCPNSIGAFWRATASPNMSDPKPPALDLPPEARFEAVYVDANVLISHGATGADFRKLVQTSVREKIGIFCPEVAVSEWIWKRVKDINSDLSKLTAAAGRLRAQIGWNPLGGERPEGWAADVEKEMRSQLAKLNISTLATPASVDVPKLLPMAIRHEATFEPDDKGFKDAVILLTILDHLRGLRQPTGLLVSNDDVFLGSAVSKHCRDCEANLVVARNPQEAVAFIDQQRKFANEAWLAGWSARARKFVETRFDDVSQFVKRHGAVSPRIDGDAFGGGRITHLHDVRPIGIKAVRYGHLLELEKPHTDPAWDPASIIVAVELDAQVTRANIRWYRLAAAARISFLDGHERQPIPPGHSETEAREAVSTTVSLMADLKVEGNVFSDLKLLDIY